MNLSIDTTVRIAFYSTLVRQAPFHASDPYHSSTFLQIESIVGVILCALYVLFHFCTIPVHCPSTGKLDQVAYVFYTTYLRGKGLLAV